MTVINIYLTFDGNCEEAFEYYKTVFNKEFSDVNRFSEMPPSEDMTIADADKNKLMHISMPISSETVLMGSDMIEGFGPPLVVGNNFSISVRPDSREEADRIFNALSDGGEVTMPMDETFWGAYFGMTTDKYGIAWMINLDPN